MKILKNLFTLSFVLMVTQIFSNAQELSNNHSYIDKYLVIVQNKIKASRAEYGAAMNSPLKPSPTVEDLQESLDSLLQINSNYVKEDYSFDCYFENGYSGKVNSKGTMIELYDEWERLKEIKLKFLAIENKTTVDADGMIFGNYLFKGNSGTFLTIKYKIVNGDAQIVGEELSSRVKLPGSQYSDYGICAQNK